jgi:predicted Zn-dependent protease
MTLGDVAEIRRLRLRQAQVLPYAGDAETPRAILAELVRQDPRDRAALRTLADLETWLERWDAASAALRRLVGLEDGGAAVETALHLAEACERAGRPGDARAALERARTIAPDDGVVRERLERVYEHTGAWHELAGLALERARGSGDVAERFALLVRAGALLSQAGDPATAVVTLQEALALRPTDSECVGLLADAYTISGRAADASALLEQAMGHHKGRRARELAPLYWRLARVARASGDAAGEARALGQALDCDQQNGRVCSDVASRATELEQIDLANRALRAVTLLKTPGPMSKAVAYQHMGQIARRQGDPKRALTLLRRALAEDPTLEGAKAMLEATERGS